MVTDARRDGASMGLPEAALDIIDILRGRPPGAMAPTTGERIVGIIAGHDSLPDREVQVIEKAIDEAIFFLAGLPDVPESRPHS